MSCYCLLIGYLRKRLSNKSLSVGMVLEFVTLGSYMCLCNCFLSLAEVVEVTLATFLALSWAGVTILCYGNLGKTPVMKPRQQ